ncbi:adenylate kinase family protein [Kitasatospora sp. NPDC059722]|uniref:adenylate kinase family protein n=1 Tax=Kitasatospora sp. NPDC059722 TaxID=3346925 RepID=UPI003696E073
MRIVLLEPPAWPRESPGASLAGALAVPRIGFGDLIRAHLRERTELGRRAHEFMNSGERIPDEISSAIVADHLRQASPAGFILTNHPLNTTQARALDELLHRRGTSLDAVVHLRLPEDELERHIRLSADRRLCRTDPSHTYEPPDNPPPGDGICPACGSELYQRDDDEETKVRARFAQHEERAQPLTRHYAAQGLLVTVDATDTPEAIAGHTLTALRRHGS